MRSLPILAVVLVTAALGWSPAPTPAAAATSFVVVNAASSQSNPVARGAMLALLTDGPVSPDTSHVYDLVTVASGGLYVEATCTSLSVKRLPIASVTTTSSGHRVTVYLPNAIGPEPFGPCDNEGPTQFRLRPADGFGPIITQDSGTVQGHPGIFLVGEGIPDGNHVDGDDNSVRTSLPTCNALLPQQSTVCRSRTAASPAVLEIFLTGSEWFLCEPCSPPNIFFELAPVMSGGTVGPYTPQFLMSLTPVRTGVEMARVMLNLDVPAGEFRLRVRNAIRPEFPPPLVVEFGQPT